MRSQKLSMSCERDEVVIDNLASSEVAKDTEGRIVDPSEHSNLGHIFMKLSRFGIGPVGLNRN